MPENAYRTAHLHQHLVRSAQAMRGGYEAARARYLHPDWPLCSAGCGWPLHPAATMGWDGTPGVYDTHPTCDPEAMAPTTQTETTTDDRRRGDRRHTDA